MSSGHLRAYVVDGLYLGNSVFNWNDRLIFAHIDGSDVNVAVAYVAMSTSFKQVQDGASIEEFVTVDSKDQGDATELLSIFFACYYLSNNKIPPRFFKDYLSIIPFTDIKSALDNWIQRGVVPHNVSQFSKKSLGNLNTLNSALPLFDKVMKAIDQNRSLRIALLVYQRSLETSEILKRFIDLVTVLEALFSDSKDDLTYKFRLRTTLFFEPDPSKRRDLFDNLKKIYQSRSALVHGNDMTLEPVSDYNAHLVILEPLVKKSLIEYIELVSQNKSKKNIIDTIDNMALGAD